MSNSLKINVFLIPEEGQEFIFSEGDQWFRECLQGAERPDFTLDHVDVTCLVTKASATIFVRGSLTAVIDIACSRCMEKAKLSIEADFFYTLMPAKAETREDLELKPEELEISYYQGDFIDLAPIICEQIILQIPMKVICREECRGLCQHCGANLNVSSCNCRNDCADSRMAALENFKIKN